MGKIFSGIILLFQICLTSHALGLDPITPDKALTKDEIGDIVENKNYFYYKDLDDKTPIWIRKDPKKQRKYSHHFLGRRVDYHTMDNVIEAVLTTGFPIQYRIQELYQGKLGVHSRLGKLLPSLDIHFGQGISGVDIGKVFSGLFGFLLPSNWMKLANQKHLYDVAKMSLERTALDEILKVKLLYLNQHQRIQEFEILNYYFIHLQLLAQEYSDNSRAMNTLIGKFALQGTYMATQRGDTKWGYDDITLAMGLEKIGGDHTAQTFNISDIKNFPTHVPDLDEKYKVKDEFGNFKEVEGKYVLPLEYRDMKTFLEQVVRRSIELKIVKKLYKVSRLNIGVEALGNMLDYVDRPGNTGNDARFSFSFGYDSVPDILIARSKSHVHEIKVREEFIKMLNSARWSFHYYTNSLGGYTEATRSMKVNRKAFKQNLESMLHKNLEPDGIFLRAFDQVMRTELKLNNALHNALRAKAYMDRFLLVDDDNALRHLPGNGKLLKMFEDVISKDHTSVRKKQRLYEVLSRTNRSARIKQVLFETKKIAGLENCKPEELREAVTKCMDILLKSKPFFYKSSRYYKALERYIKKESIDLSLSQRSTLKRKIDSVRERLFGSKPAKDDFYNNFDFEHFETGDR